MNPWDELTHKDLFLDGTFEPRPEDHKTISTHTFEAATKFVSHGLNLLFSQPELLAPLSTPVVSGEIVARLFLDALNEFSVMTTALPARSSSEEKFVIFLSNLHQRIATMAVGRFLLIPGGWANDQEGDGYLLYLLERRSDSFSFTIINTNSMGISYYHPVKGGPSGNLVYKLSITIDNISVEKLTDSSFWFFLMRLQIWPVNMNDCQTIYEVLLPSLNAKPLSATLHSNVDGTTVNSPWRTAPTSGDLSMTHCILEAANVMMARIGLSERQIQYFGMIFKWQTLQNMWKLVSTSDLKINDVRKVQNYVRQMASDLAEAITPSQGTLVNSQQASTMYQALEAMNRLLTQQQQSSKKLVPEVRSSVPHELTVQVNNRAVDFEGIPLLQTLMRENVESLAGWAQVETHFRPVQFTLVPETISDFIELTLGLTHVDQICTLLAYQTTQIQYTHTLTVSLIQHMFTRVIPIPLSNNHPNSSQCMYRQPVRYETQLNLLRLLHHIALHFAACSMSIRVNRIFDASRILTMAALAAVTDAVARMRAFDIPSMFSLHLNGTPPPSPRYFFQPFGFDASVFRTQSQDLIFTTPELVVTRTRVLDYFTTQRELIKDDHVIFQFEQNMQTGNINTLLEQMCWEIGFPSENLPLYLSGEQSEILYNYPELLYYRDIVFLFKYLTTPDQAALPQVKPWFQKDAKLSWSFREGEGFTVNGFKQSLRSVHPLPDTEKTTFWSRLFSKKNRNPSGADPSEIAGKPVENEEDILHIPQLPTFEGKLTQSASELLISYLTVPYMRIPLVLNFFASQEHINSLGVLDLENIIDSVVFEPGQWQPPTEKVLPTNVPAPDRHFLATPLGLLFNELRLSPEANLKPLNVMLENALDLDPGCYTEEAGFMILYVIRLLVRIEGFMIFFISHSEWDRSMVSKSMWEGFARGLETTPDFIRIMRNKRKELRGLMDEQVYPMLERWVEHAIKVDDLPTACLLYAHLAYLFLHSSYDELTPSNVVTLLSSQIFLNSHYHFNSQNDTGKKMKRTANGDMTIGLGIADTEIFDLFQKQRLNLLKYLEDDQDRRNDIMERIVKVVTMVTKNPNNPLASAGLTRHWRNMDGLHNVGRFIPDLTSRTAEQQAKADAERYQSRGQLGGKVETEVNIQLGTLTLNNAIMERVDPRIYAMDDFKEVFGEQTHLACASVKTTAKRNWVRVMGTRFDLQLWKPDDRLHNIPNFTRKYDPSSFGPSESWISDIFEPIRAKFKLFPSGEIFMPNSTYTSQDVCARLIGFEVDPTSVTDPKQSAPKQKTENCTECRSKFSMVNNKRYYCKRCGVSLCGNCSFVGKIHNSTEEIRLCPKCKAMETQRKYMREVVVLRKHKTIHYYRIMEHGRQFYRTLIFSSDWR
ncbi:hypothetical protein PROFUN_12661 [Planoprotostelium fungivorum]|uniref:ubiquitinyl hydrolase 1 n=1 Tax=Planoprotostelium fungivorum TaxID=1890364 RepID=A0A2P6N714_9EUKA|nr:hypothetical protein PROFUN_12661 [Planoprotostelium fungivorum]